LFVKKRYKEKLLISSGGDIADYQIQEGDELQAEGVVTSSVRMHREPNKKIE